MDDRTLTISKPGSGLARKPHRGYQTRATTRTRTAFAACDSLASRTLVHAANAAIAGPPALRDVGKFVPGRVSPRASPVAVFLTSHKRPRLVSTA